MIRKDAQPRRPNLAQDTAAQTSQNKRFSKTHHILNTSRTVFSQVCVLGIWVLLGGFWVPRPHFGRPGAHFGRPGAPLGAQDHLLLEIAILEPKWFFSGACLVWLVNNHTRTRGKCAPDVHLPTIPGTSLLVLELQFPIVNGSWKAANANHTRHTYWSLKGRAWYGWCLEPSRHHLLLEIAILEPKETCLVWLMLSDAQALPRPTGGVPGHVATPALFDRGALGNTKPRHSNQTQNMTPQIS